MGRKSFISFAQLAPVVWHTHARIPHMRAPPTQAAGARVSPTDAHHHQLNSAASLSLSTSRKRNDNRTPGSLSAFVMAWPQTDQTRDNSGEALPCAARDLLLPVETVLDIGFGFALTRLTAHHQDDNAVGQSCPDDAESSSVARRTLVTPSCRKHGGGRDLLHRCCTRPTQSTHTRNTSSPTLSAGQDEVWQPQGPSSNGRHRDVLCLHDVFGQR